MIKVYAVVFLLLLGILPLARSHGACGTDRVNEDLRKRSPHLFEERPHQSLQQRATCACKGPFSIEVHFHVLWHLDGENVADEDLQNELTNWNNWLSGTPQDVLNSIRPELQFLAADKDLGITFTMGTVKRRWIPDNWIDLSEDIGYLSKKIKDYCYGGLDAVRGKNARETVGLNVWIVNSRSEMSYLSGESYVAGYAYFPGLSDNTRSGIVLHFDGVGEADYTTGVHELGHYLGLYHTFNGQQCGGDGDYVSDTPALDQNSLSLTNCNSYRACGTMPNQGVTSFSSLGGLAAVFHENVMDYGSCTLPVVTNGQVTRMTDQICNLYTSLQHICSDSEDYELASINEDRSCLYSPAEEGDFCVADNSCIDYAVGSTYACCDAAQNLVCNEATNLCIPEEVGPYSGSGQQCRGRDFCGSAWDPPVNCCDEGLYCSFPYANFQGRAIGGTCAAIPGVPDSSSPLALGESCSANSECISGFCGNQICTAGQVGDDCDNLADCSVSYCALGKCSAGTVGSSCSSDSHCSASAPICALGQCSAGTVGSSCSSDSHCSVSAPICALGQCSTGAAGSSCSSDSHCASSAPFCALEQCSTGAAGSSCSSDSHCGSSAPFCALSQCSTGAVGSSCDDISDCTSGTCNSNVCTATVSELTPCEMVAQARGLPLVDDGVISFTNFKYSVGKKRVWFQVLHAFEEADMRALVILEDGSLFDIGIRSWKGRPSLRYLSTFRQKSEYPLHYVIYDNARYSCVSTVPIYIDL